MRCNGCGFVLPDDFPYTKVSLVIAGKVSGEQWSGLCAPCARWASQEAYERPDEPMTPSRIKPGDNVGGRPVVNPMPTVPESGADDSALRRARRRSR